MEAVFDTLKYFDKLKAAGFTEEQAKVHAETLRELVDSTLATKRDLKELELRLIIRLGGIVITCTTILGVLQLFFGR